MKRAPVMKNAPQIKIEDAAPRNTGSNPTAPAVANLTSRLRGMTGNHITLNVCGRDVEFTLKTVTASMVEKATMVWTGNERVQELLTKSALEDLLPSFEVSGQQNPAFGRESCGIIEVADGSRRRMTAIYTNRDYRVLVGDLDYEQMAWLSKVGNEYQPTSAFERGKRYARRLHEEFDGNVSKLSDAEKISRKIIARCIATSELPSRVLCLFDRPNDLSARAGEKLAKVYFSNSNAVDLVVSGLEKLKQDGRKLTADEIISAISHPVETRKEKERKVRSFGSGITATYKPNGVSFTLKDAPDMLINQIERLLEEHDLKQQKQAKDEIESAMNTLDKVVGLIREASTAVGQPLTDTQVQVLIPLARTVAGESTSEKEKVDKVGQEIIKRFSQQ